MIRRKRPKLVMSRNTITQAIQILEKSIVLDTAPPFQTGERKPPMKSRTIMVSSSHASFGRSLNVRLVRPKLLNKPQIARMAVILARGAYLRPGTQSSGRAQ